MARSHLSLAALIEALDATELDDAILTVCVPCCRCGQPRLPYADGRSALCRRCTVEDVGESEFSLALRVEFGLSRKVVNERLEQYGPPYLNLKAWITPRSKLFR